MLIRLIDFLKMNDITLVMTALVTGGYLDATTGMNISSLVDTWLTLTNDDRTGERRRTIAVVKARGMRHSNLVHELAMSNKGVEVNQPIAARIGS